MANSPLLIDSWIAFRESILDWVTQTDKEETLNSGPDASITSEEPDKVLQYQIPRLLIALGEQDGRLDYDQLCASPAYNSYRQYVAALRTVSLSSLGSRARQLAFWINLYNLLTLDAVIAMKIERSVAERWAGFAFFRKAAYFMDGQRFSLDDVEHGILRANRGHPCLPGDQFPSDDARNRWVISPMDVRVHFALNCASRSCPPIRAYNEEQLESQLNMATRNYLSQEVLLFPRQNKLCVPAIFQWFREDFGGRAGVVEFISAYLPDAEQRDWIEQNKDRLKLAYSPYDWRLQLGGKLASSVG